MPYANPIDKKIYDMGYGEKNKKRLQESRKKYYQRDETKQRRKINYKKYKDKWTKQAIEGYGGECLFCGEDRPEALLFHHVNGNGTEHRGKIGNGYSFFKWIVENNFPDEIILLCGTCHLILHRAEGDDD